MDGSDIFHQEATLTIQDERTATWFVFAFSSSNFIYFLSVMVGTPFYSSILIMRIKKVRLSLFDVFCNFDEL